MDAIAQTVDLVIGIYKDQPARVGGSVPDDIYHAWPDYATILGTVIDVRAAAYAFLHTLPAFAGAVDVL